MKARGLGGAFALSVLLLAPAHDLALATTFARAALVRTRRVGKFSNLTGAWSGAYAYPSAKWPETPFNALIEDVGGALTGTTQEPNLMLVPDLGPNPTATIAGTRSGRDVHFVKTMHGLSHVIIYDGRVDADFMRVEGRWRIPGNWSGTFFMERAGAVEEAAAERSASASN